MVIAISRATANDLVDLLGLSGDRIHLVHPVVVRARPSPVQSNLSRRFFLSERSTCTQAARSGRALAEFRQTRNVDQSRVIGPSSAPAPSDLLQLAAPRRGRTFPDRGPDIKREQARPQGSAPAVFVAPNQPGLGAATRRLGSRGDRWAGRVIGQSRLRAPPRLERTGAR